MIWLLLSSSRNRIVNEFTRIRDAEAWAGERLGATEDRALQSGEPGEDGLRVLHLPGDSEKLILGKRADIAAHYPDAVQRWDDVDAQMRETGRAWERAKEKVDRLHEDRKALAVRAYQAGVKRVDIMAELSITDATLSVWLKAAGVQQVRPRSRYRK